MHPASIVGNSTETDGLNNGGTFPHSCTTLPTTTDMEHPVSPASFLSAFADYVHDQRDEIGRRWMQLVRESPDVPGAMHISQEALQDHVPELLDDLVERMRTENEETTEEVADHSRSHGREQWKAGYNISDLIWEIYIIRRVLTQSVLADFARNNPEYSAEERAKASTLIHDFFHRLTCHSVGQFIVEQQRAIQEKNEELRQTSESRARLTRTVSHELRNVLNALTLGIKLLGEEEQEQDRRDMVNVCSKMLSDMARILNDLLDYSALVAGHAELTLERISLPELFEEIVSQWQPSAEGHGLKFECICDPALGEIVSDKLKLKQIAGNLLSNAIKYRKSTQGGFVGISFSPYGTTTWKMVVVDTGVGIAREDMGALFGEFSRIRPSGVVTGTGLGLAICKEFAELLGGRIEVLSEVGQGTRFEVALPMTEEMPASARRSLGTANAVAFEAACSKEVK
jgi:signal transduction histidine kinase